MSVQQSKHQEQMVKHLAEQLKRMAELESQYQLSSAVNTAVSLEQVFVW